MYLTKKVLVTGAAGFIGYHLVKRLLSEGYEVTGNDNLNNYYDPYLKTLRLEKLIKSSSSTEGSFNFIEQDISDRLSMENLFLDINFDVVISLAAQAGVRNSLDDPHSYANSNLTGFLNILEGCRHIKPEHLIFASSSSVYGMNNKIPFSSFDSTDYPVSFYAATKKSNELMAHAYSHLYAIPTTGLRFFTVYGPYGRPDMAYYKFTDAILDGRAIDVYNNGEMMRDFTYIDDIVETVIKLIPKAPELLKPPGSNAETAFKIYNVGNNKPVKLMDFIKAIEKASGKKAKLNYLPLQPGDVLSTYAAIDDLIAEIEFSPKTPIEKGISKFVNWYKAYKNERIMHK